MSGEHHHDHPLDHPHDPSRAATWIGVDLGGTPDVDDVEHHVLAAVDTLTGHAGPGAGLGVELDVDFVATHVVPGLVPRAAAALRLRHEGRPDAGTAPRHLFDLLGGAVVTAPAGERPGVLGDEDLAREALVAAAASREGLAGRCVRFPGQARLTGVLPVRRILERSAIARVAGSGWTVAEHDVVETRGFLRPGFEAGQLVLRVGPAAGGVLVPSEAPDPHECCAGHP